MKFVIPFASPMVYMGRKRSERVLCYNLDRGYFESDSTDEFFNLFTVMDSYSSIRKVAGLDLIKCDSSKELYRQRVFFHSMCDLFSICKLCDVTVVFPSSFHVGIRSILSCTEKLKVMVACASANTDSIDNWLTNCCIIQAEAFAKKYSIDFKSNLRKKYLQETKKGYLDRAPYLMISKDKYYSCEDTDSWLYSDSDHRGFSCAAVDYDRKSGRLKIW